MSYYNIDNIDNNINIYDKNNYTDVEFKTNLDDNYFNTEYENNNSSDNSPSNNWDNYIDSDNSPSNNWDNYIDTDNLNPHSDEFSGITNHVNNINEMKNELDNKQNINIPNFNSIKQNDNPYSSLDNEFCSKTPLNNISDNLDFYNLYNQNNNIHPNTPRNLESFNIHNQNNNIYNNLHKYNNFQHNNYYQYNYTPNYQHLINKSWDKNKNETDLEKKKILKIDDLYTDTLPDVLKEYTWVENLVIHSNFLRYLKNLPPNLKILNVADCKIMTFNQEDIPISINKLNLDNNLISELPDLSDLENLVFLNANNNLIKKVNGSLPNNLQKLDLSDNKFTSLDCIFMPYTLEELNLNNNEITNIKNLPEYLLTLELENNNLKNIDLKYNTYLTKLDITRNIFNNIPFLPDSLKYFKADTNFINKIENLPSKLKELKLWNNEIIKIENLPKSLQKIDLSGNKITKIENIPQKVENLDLDDNKIEDDINFDLINDNIKILNLDNNKIKKINSLPTSLIKLSASNCNINKIVFLNDNIKYLDLSNNNLEGELNLNYYDTLIEVNFSNNKFDELSFNLPNSLIKLNLNNNNIKSFKDINYIKENNLDTKNITDLILTNNPLTNINKFFLLNELIKHNYSNVNESLFKKIISKRNISI